MVPEVRNSSNRSACFTYLTLRLLITMGLNTQKLYLTLMLGLSWVWALAQAPEQDCFSSILICSPTYNQSNSYSGIGTIVDVAPGQTCLGNGEVNSVWYSITATQSGTFGFQLNPVNATDDYDFAVFNLTGDSCSSIANGTLAPIRCNYSATTGPTGLSGGANQTNVGTSGPNQCSMINVNAGETYMILVSNFTSSQSGYTLNITGNSSILDNVAPTIANVNLNGSCNPSRLLLELSEPVLCSSLNGTSEVTITGPMGVAITSVQAIACSQEGLTTQMRVNLAQALTTVGTYTITISNGADGDTWTDRCGNQIPNGFTITFQVQYIGPTITLNNIVPTDCGMANGSIDVSVSGGAQPYVYNWNSSPVQTTQDANNLDAGTYRLRVTDANGCMVQMNFNVTSSGGATLSAGNVVHVSCFGGNDGSAQVLVNGGNAPFAYEWNTTPPQITQTASNLAAGNYTCTVTDAAGCNAIRNFSISQPTPILASNTHVPPDCGQSNGSITMSATGGTPGYNYFWNMNPGQVGATAINLGAGLYNVNITDANGCLTQATVVLNNAFAPNASVTASTPDCGQNSGSATVQATSGQQPLNYVWNTQPPQFGQTATGLSSGDYFVTITDANGCIQFINVKIDTITPPSVILSATPSDCGMNNGSIDAAISNGTQPYAINWSHDATLTATTAAPLGPGTYSLIVTDGLGCIDTATVQLIELPPTSSFTANTVCEGFATQFESTTTSMATNFVWDFGDGQTGSGQQASHTYAAPGTYTVTLQLLGGCQNDQVTVSGVTVNPNPKASFTTNPEVVTTRTPATFQYTGTPVQSYNWDIAGTPGTNAPVVVTVIPTEGSQDVALVVTDANGCADTVVQTIEVLLEPGLFLPNSFKLSSAQSANQFFRFFGTGITDGELTIHDRWGKQMYYSNNLTELTTMGWNGTCDGTVVPEDAYGYRVWCRFYNGREFNAVGTINVLY